MEAREKRRGLKRSEIDGQTNNTVEVHYVRSHSFGDK